MASDLEVFKSFMNTKIKMLERAGKQEAEGNTQDSQAISKEWDGTLIDNMMTLTIDDFVKL